MSELATGPLGPEGSFKLDLSGGKLLLTLNYKGEGGEGQLTFSVDSGYFLDKLAEKIPGQIDNAIFGLLKLALKQA